MWVAKNPLFLDGPEKLWLLCAEPPESPPLAIKVTVSLGGKPAIYLFLIPKNQLKVILTLINVR
jgi:hypothetical protein